MLEKAADTLIAAVELFEAEGRHLRRTGADFTFWGICVVGSAIIATAGIAALLIGVAMRLAEVVGVAGALAIIGAAAAIFGVVLAALARHQMRAAGGNAS
ncbi:MAG: hypothetical protein ACIAQU_02745 [Phycisphaerales bacterium JB064]